MILPRPTPAKCNTASRAFWSSGCTGTIRLRFPLPCRTRRVGKSVSRDRSAQGLGHPQASPPLEQHQESGAGVGCSGENRLDFVSLQVLRQRGTFLSGILLQTGPFGVNSPGAASSWSDGGGGHGCNIMPNFVAPSTGCCHCCCRVTVSLNTTWPTWYLISMGITPQKLSQNSLFPGGRRLGWGYHPPPQSSPNQGEESRVGVLR